MWTDQNFSARFGQHPEVTANGVVKKPGVRKSRPGLSRRTGPSRVVVVPKQYIAWIGVRFRTRDDELDPTADLGGSWVCEQV